MYKNKIILGDPRQQHYIKEINVLYYYKIIISRYFLFRYIGRNLVNVRH